MVGKVGKVEGEVFWCVRVQPFGRRVGQDVESGQGWKVGQLGAQCGFEVVGVETDEEVAVSGEAVQYGTVGFCREAGDVENQRRMAGKLADCAEQPALILFRVVV